jgi:glycosyltransferase involved in cell wall biosynthesis
MSDSIIFYNDSEVFGGHEKMSALIANTLAESRPERISFIASHPGFGSELTSDIEFFTLPFNAKTFVWSQRSPGFMQLSYLRRLFRERDPRLIVVCQGYIESGVRGLLASHSLDATTVSYIPLGYTNREMGTRMAWIRDRIRWLPLRLPGAFLTVSAFQAQLIRRHTATRQNVYVIRNPVSFNAEGSIDPPQLDLRVRLRVAVIGRVRFQQKNQNILIEVAQLLEAKSFPLTIHIVGDGPDLVKLKESIRELRLENTFQLHGWLERTEIDRLLSTDVDVIVIPSHYEGLPLVLLEALEHNKPFLISALGFTADYEIPVEWQFDPNNPEDIADKLMKFVGCFNPQDFISLRTQAMRQHSRENFMKEVDCCFASLLDS